MTANSNCGPNDTCNDVPYWTIAGNTSIVSLSCTRCVDTTVYANSYSDNFQDIQILINVGGFSSDQLPYTVYIPYKLTSYSSNRDDLEDGYQTSVNLDLFDKFDDSIAGLAVNESFDNNFIPDFDNLQGWVGPMPVSAPAGWLPDRLSDRMFAYNCDATVPKCTNYDSSNPSIQKVFHTLQNWAAGSDIAGNGIKIRSDIQQCYTDRAEHVNVVSPTPTTP